jgi:cation:H+ antiporter
MGCMRLLRQDGSVPDLVPETVTAAVLLVAGAGLLTAGAEAFAEHLSAAAARLRLSVLALGVLLAGAEPEEAVTAMLASGRGRPELAAGDAVGANLVILSLTLGLAALLAPLPVGRRVLQYAGGAVAAGILAVVAMADGVLGRGEGTVLVVAYAAAVVWVWRRERQPPVVGEVAELRKEDTAQPQSAQPQSAQQQSAQPQSAQAQAQSQSQPALLLVLLGLLGMVAGGFLAVHGAERVVEALDVTDSVVGLTVLALATSAEMLALVVAAHRRGLSEIALAGAIGAVAYNATITLGIAAWVEPLVLDRESPVLRVGLVTAVLPLLLWTGRRTGHLPRPLGVVLVAVYAVAVGWLLGR